VRDVPDPYYNGRFDEVYELVEQGGRGLLERIIAEQGLNVKRKT
jgi:protein-tyrosine phosphatase